MEHRLKCLPQYYDDVESGAKTFEVRQNDRDYRVGDVLVLRRYDLAERCYLDDQELRRRVTYILPGPRFGVSAGYVVMALEPLP